MKILEGKSPAERNKIFAAAALGALALVAMIYMFWSSFSTPVRIAGSNSSTKTTPTPKKTDDKNSNPNNSSTVQTPDDVRQEDDLLALTPIFYSPFESSAPEPSRNIFAFYNPADEPPAPPTPIKVFVPKTPVPIEPPTPLPPPPLIISYITPNAVYARTNDFTLEVIGDKFTPETRIIFNGSEIPTRFMSPQKLAATVPAAFIAGEGQRQIMVRTPDGVLFSNPAMLNVQAPPAPTYLFVGFIGRKRYNNDTAVLYNKTKKEYLNLRLNDTARLSENAPNMFRVVSLNVNEIIVEDAQLKIRHKLPYQVEQPGKVAGNNGGNPYGQPNPNGGFQQYDIPGIPNNIPRYQPNQPNPTIPAQQGSKQDDDDDNN